MAKKKMVKKKKEVIVENKNNSLMYLAVGVFVLALLLLSGSFTGHAVSNQTSYVSDLFGSWGSGNLDVNIAKYLFFGMLALLIFASFNAAKFPKNMALQWLIAIPIAFLATAYIAPKEIMSILTTYSALGIALSVVVPFIVMIFFSSMLLSYGKTTVGKIMAQVFLWFVFGVVLAYKLIMGIISGEVSIGLNAVFIVTFGAFIVVLFIFVKNKKFRTWVMKLGLEIRHWEGEYEQLSLKKANDMAKGVEYYGGLQYTPYRP